MSPPNSIQRMLEALFRTHTYPHDTTEHTREARHVTVAFSRQAGSQGASLARLVGERLGWPVFDSELLQHIADQSGVRVRLLESLDERRANWVSDFVETFFSLTRATERVYLRHLLETMGSLAAKGECIIVGRGAPQFLPAETTLRVRVVGDLMDRIAFVQSQQGCTRDEAAAWIDRTDKERRRFILEHFHKDPDDPVAHDLVLNSSRFSVPECADVVQTAARAMQTRMASQEAASHPVMVGSGQ